MTRRTYWATLPSWDRAVTLVRSQNKSNGGHPISRVTLLSLVAILAVGVGAAHADRPEGGNSNGPGWRAGSPGTFITVTPSDRLVDGQSVQVSGTGFGANETVNLFECSLDVGGCVARGSAPSDSDGSFGPESVTVSRIVRGHECRLGRGDCIIEGVDFSSTYVVDGITVCCLFANHHISFRPAHP
jgi:Neocarzinostatin family